MRLDAVQSYGTTINTQQAAQAQPVHEIPQDASSLNVEALPQDAEQQIKEVKKDNGATAGEEFEEHAEARQQTEQEIENENERIRKTIGDLNKKMSNHAEAIFGIHDKTNRVTIKMVDKDSKKVIKEFPPEKTLDMIAKVWELAGIMVDEKG